MGLTASIQDYLKVIYELTESGTAASTSDLAEHLAVTPASITGMLQKLASASHPLIRYRKHQGARLTREGRLAALEVIRRHRLIEAWLVQSLGYTWDAVHGEAEVLEHVISEDFERRISDALGNPRRDPHGDPIPSPKLVMPKDASVPLSALHASQEAVVLRVQARQPELLRHLGALGIGIGARLAVLEVSEFDHVMRLQVRDTSHPLNLGPAITSQIFVQEMGAHHRQAKGPGSGEAVRTVREAN